MFCNVDTLYVHNLSAVSQEVYCYLAVIFTRTVYINNISDTEI